MEERPAKKYYESFIGKELTGITFHEKKGTLEASPSDLWDLMEGFAKEKNQQHQELIKKLTEALQKAQYIYTIRVNEDGPLTSILEQNKFWRETKTILKELE